MKQLDKPNLTLTVELDKLVNMICTYCIWQRSRKYNIIMSHSRCRQNFCKLHMRLLMDFKIIFNVRIFCVKWKICFTIARLVRRALIALIDPCFISEANNDLLSFSSSSSSLQISSWATTQFQSDVDLRFDGTWSCRAYQIFWCSCLVFV